MRAAIHQSQYLPWPPYFKKMAACDLFVLMDTVQYQKNGVQNRNQVRNKDAAFWLTIPVTGHLDDTIRDKKVADDKWRVKHGRSIKEAYAKAPHWNPEIEAAYANPFATLGEANDVLLSALMKLMGLSVKIVRLSELDAPGKGSELVLNICKAVGATTYVSGTGAKAYLDEAAFEKAGIPIEYLESKPPEYPQFHGGAFIPGLSVVDMLMNVGRAGMEAYLR